MSGNLSYAPCIIQYVLKKHQNFYDFFYLSFFLSIFKSKKDFKLYVGWLVVFHGISTLIGYLMPNPLYIYIYIWFENKQFFGNNFYICLDSFACT